jgi:hypothetical protein
MTAAHDTSSAHSNSWADMSKGTRVSFYIRITFILPAVIDVLSALEICALLSVHRVGKEAVGCVICGMREAGTLTLARVSPVVEQILDRTRRTINKIVRLRTPNVTSNEFDGSCGHSLFLP